jgi:hypothetical protein
MARVAAAQFKLQEPGPRGSPHEPHGAGPALAERAGEPVDTAKTDSCLSRACEWHAGHSAGRDALTMASNGCWQSRHTYSKIGMTRFYRNS